MISVIIPAYNEEKYLEQTIISVRSQLVPHEVIVVPNGCTDNTEKIAKKFADKTISIKTRGVSKARNKGASISKYNTLVFLDADTVLSKNVLNHISKCKGYGTARAAPGSKNLKDNVYFFLKFLTQYTRSSAGLIFCSKEIFNNVGGFDESLSKFEDGIFLKKANKHAKFYVITSPVHPSTRRYQKIGYANTVLFWIKEYFFPSKKEYEAIR